MHLPHATAPGGRRALTRGQRDRRLPATRLGCSLCHLAARDARGGAWPPSRHLRRQPCRPRAYRGRWLADHGPSPRRDGHIASSGTGSSTTGNRPPPSSSSSSSSAAPPPSAPTRLYTCCPPSCCRQAFARLALASSRPPPASPARGDALRRGHRVGQLATDGARLLCRRRGVVRLRDRASPGDRLARHARGDSGLAVGRRGISVSYANGHGGRVSVCCSRGIR